MYSIDTRDTRGRFGNYFFRNMVGTILAKKFNLKAIYGYQDIFDKLHINLYSGDKKHKNKLKIDNSNFMNYIIDDNIVNLNNNVMLTDYYQTSDFCKYLKNYFDIEHRGIFNDKNPYRERISNNNDLFIHVRLGDISHINPGYDYYSNIIKDLSFENGYICSDSPNSAIVNNLIQNYNLKSYDRDIHDIFLFGSTCKYIILSEGSFSWLLGFLSDNNSTIYYPKNKIIWHGDIFVYDTWNRIIIE
jgi:hypothetical protein